MTSLQEVHKLIEGLIKTTNEIKAILERKSADKPAGIEEAAAKIIKDIGDKIDRCECTKKIEEMLQKKQSETGTTIVPAKQESRGFDKYSFPNFNVGNEELGSTGNPNAVKWPPKK